MTKTSFDAPSMGAGKQTGLARLWTKYRTYRATLAALRSLTEKQLGDIGFNRHALKITAHRAVYGH